MKWNATAEEAHTVHWYFTCNGTHKNIARSLCCHCVCLNLGTASRSSSSLALGPQGLAVFCPHSVADASYSSLLLTVSMTALQSTNVHCTYQ